MHNPSTDGERYTHVSPSSPCMSLDPLLPRFASGIDPQSVCWLAESCQFAATSEYQNAPRRLGTDSLLQPTHSNGEIKAWSVFFLTARHPWDRVVHARAESLTRKEARIRNFLESLRHRAPTLSIVAGYFYSSRHRPTRSLIDVPVQANSDSGHRWADFGVSGTTRQAGWFNGGMLRWNGEKKCLERHKSGGCHT